MTPGHRYCDSVSTGHHLGTATLTSTQGSGQTQHLTSAVASGRLLLLRLNLKKRWARKTNAHANVTVRPGRHLSLASDPISVTTSTQLVPGEGLATPHRSLFSPWRPRIARNRPPTGGNRVTADDNVRVSDTRPETEASGYLCLARSHFNTFWSISRINAVHRTSAGVHLHSRGIFWHLRHLISAVAPSDSFMVR